MSRPSLDCNNTPDIKLGIAHQIMIPETPAMYDELRFSDSDRRFGLDKKYIFFGFSHRGFMRLALKINPKIA